MPLKEIVKLVPAVRAVIAVPPARVANVLLHVTLSAVPSVLSGVKKIFEVVAILVVSTTSVGLVPVGIATNPAEAAPHTAGEAALAQAPPSVISPGGELPLPEYKPAAIKLPW